MIEFRFGPADLARVRFARSPLEETVHSLRTDDDPSRREMHRPWRVAVQPVLAGLDLPLLHALTANRTALPDFLCPPPDRLDVSFADEVAAVRAAAEEDVRRGVAEIGARGPAVQELLDDPARGLARLADELHAYWSAAVEPFWPRLRALLDADLAYRARQLTTGGLEALFADLHPSITYTGDVLRVAKPVDSVRVLDGAGLLLVPSVFGWPNVGVVHEEPFQPGIGYAPRGVGQVWTAVPDTGRGPLAALLGRSRAVLLARLDLPVSTTALAANLEMTAATVSHHLSVLHKCNLVDRRRAGREILYQRTQLGTSLLTA